MDDAHSENHACIVSGACCLGWVVGMGGGDRWRRDRWRGDGQMGGWRWMEMDGEG